MVIFHSYVSLPEGRSNAMLTILLSRKKQRSSAARPLYKARPALRLCGFAQEGVSMWDVAEDGQLVEIYKSSVSGCS